MASLRVNLKRCSARSPPSIRSMHASPSYTRPPKCLHATQLQPYHHAHCCWQRAQIRLFPRGLRRRMRPATSQPELSAGNCHRYGPVEWDLYLCSHQGILGTNKRAHYNILLDENNFTCAHRRQLSHFFFADLFCGLQDWWNSIIVIRSLPRLRALHTLRLYTRTRLCKQQSLSPSTLRTTS
jgi:hypothetical protein